MELRAGQRLKSVVSDVEIVLVRASGDEELLCGGVPMVAVDRAVDRVAPVALADVEVLIGKRYSDDSGSLEALCTKPGTGGLQLGDAVLSIKAAKALPASD